MVLMCAPDSLTVTESDHVRVDIMETQTDVGPAVRIALHTELFTAAIDHSK